MQTEEILEKLREYKAERGDAYGIETLGLFGSCARGEQLPDSDIDVCVKMKTPSFFSMSGIQNELEELFKCKVDLISLGAIMRPLFKKNLESYAHSPAWCFITRPVCACRQ